MKWTLHEHHMNKEWWQVMFICEHYMNFTWMFMNVHNHLMNSWSRTFYEQLKQKHSMNIWSRTFYEQLKQNILWTVEAEHSMNICSRGPSSHTRGLLLTGDSGYLHTGSGPTIFFIVSRILTYSPIIRTQNKVYKTNFINVLKFKMFYSNNSFQYNNTCKQHLKYDRDYNSPCDKYIKYLLYITEIFITFTITYDYNSPCDKDIKYLLYITEIFITFTITYTIHNVKTFRILSLK